MKSKGESESRPAAGAPIAMARKYLIETFGCQMNVHDSERMAGLLEQAGFESTDDAADADVVVINTCSVREHAEDKLYTRLGELRVLARGARPRSDCRRRRLRRAAGRRTHPQALGGVADIVVGTQAIRRLPMLVEEAARRRSSRRRPLVDLNPYDDVTFPLGVTRRADPVKAYVTIIEGCNEFCSFCVVPYTRGHERMRPKADILAEVREAAATGRREVQLLGQIVNHYEAPDDAGLRFHGAARSDSRRARASSGSGSPARTRGTSRRAFSRRCASFPKICRHLHLPVQSGSTRVLEAMRRRYTREQLSRSGRRDPRVAAGRRALDRYDRRLPRRDRRGLRGHAVAHGRGAVPQHVLVQVLAAAEYARRQAAARRCAGGGEDAADRGAAGARSGAIQTELNAALVGRQVDVLVDAASRRRDTEVSGRTSQNIVVNMPGPAGVDRPDRARQRRTRRRAQRLGTGRAIMQIEMSIKGLMVDPITNTPIVILRDKDGQRVLPIWVGIFEANAIALQIENVTTPRPMTHDLLRNVIQDLNATVQKIVVCDLQENTFYALIYLALNGDTLTIDARPSDAIALALRTRAPIFVEDTVIDNAKPFDCLDRQARRRAPAQVAREPRSGRSRQIQDVIAGVSS